MDNALLVDELRRDERLELKPYFDTATPPRITIGIGRNLTDRGITVEEAYHLLNNDIENVCADLDQHLPWWRSLDEVRQRVLANMCFNLGVQRLLGFKNFLAAAQSGDYDQAATEAIASVWAAQVGPRALRLSHAMRTGIAQ